MKATKDNPAPTNFLFEEIPEQDRADFLKELENNPELRQTLEELEQTKAFFSEALRSPAKKLHSAQRDLLLNTAQQPDRHPMFVVFAVAASIALFGVLGWQFMQRPERDTGKSGPVLAIDPKSDPLISALPEQEILRIGAKEGYAHLPVAPPSARALELRKSLERDQASELFAVCPLPDLLNAFDHTYEGQAVICRFTAKSWHPDVRAAVTSQHAATLAVEAIPCPWKPTASLVFLNLKGGLKADCTVLADFEASPTVKLISLPGFSETKESGAAEIRIPAGTQSSLVIYLETSPHSQILGQLKWSVNGSAAPPITVQRKAAAEASRDACFTSLLCTFDEWRANPEQRPARAIVFDRIANRLIAGEGPTTYTNAIRHMRTVMNL